MAKPYTEHKQEVDDDPHGVVDESLRSNDLSSNSNGSITISLSSSRDNLARDISTMEDIRSIVVTLPIITHNSQDALDNQISATLSSTNESLELSESSMSLSVSDSGELLE